MYFGQLLKELLRLPRPPRHLVVTLENHYSEEYGMPSTHAMNALTLPLCWFMYSAGHFIGPTWLLGTVCMLWFISCTLSRLYKGAHSPADVVVGLALGAGFVGLSFAIGDAIDEWILTSRHVAWVMPLLLILLCILYPRPVSPRWVSSPGDTIIIQGVVCGVILGVHACSSAHVAAVGSAIDFSRTDVSRVAIGAFACALGFAVLVTVRFAMKSVMTALLLQMWGPLWVDSKEMESVADLQDQKDSSPGNASPLIACIKSATPADADPSRASPSSSDRGHVSGRQSSEPSADCGSDSDPSENVICRDVSQNSSTLSPVLSGARLRHAAAAPISSSCSASVGFDTQGMTGSQTSRIGRVLVPANRRYEVELPCKAVTYTAVGFSAVYIVPLLFQILDIAQYGI
jgi:hypothetical protein